MVHCCLCIALPLLAVSLFIFSLYTVEQFKVTKHLVWTRNCQNQTKQSFQDNRQSQLRWKWQSFLTKSSHRIHPLPVAATACTLFQVFDNMYSYKTGWCVIQKGCIWIQLELRLKTGCWITIWIWMERKITCNNKCTTVLYKTLKKK